MSVKNKLKKKSLIRFLIKDKQVSLMVIQDEIIK